MKRFVEGDARIDLPLAAIGGLIIGLTQAGTGIAYLVAFGVLTLGTILTVGWERFQLWRDIDGPRGRR